MTEYAQTLEEMGFGREISHFALKATDNEGVAAALDYLLSSSTPWGHDAIGPHEVVITIDETKDRLFSEHQAVSNVESEELQLRRCRSAPCVHTFGIQRHSEPSRAAVASTSAVAEPEAGRHVVLRRAVSDSDLLGAKASERAIDDDV